MDTEREENGRMEEKKKRRRKKRGKLRVGSRGDESDGCGGDRLPTLDLDLRSTLRSSRGLQMAEYTNNILLISRPTGLAVFHPMDSVC